MNEGGTASANRDTVMAYVAAFNERDLDALAGILAEGVTLRDWNVDVRGKADVVETTRGILVGGAYLRVILHGTISEGDQVMADLSIVIDEAATLTVVDLFAFDDAGLICSIRAFKGDETPSALPLTSDRL